MYENTKEIRNYFPKIWASAIGVATRSGDCEESLFFSNKKRGVCSPTSRVLGDFRILAKTYSASQVFTEKTVFRTPRDRDAVFRSKIPIWGARVLSRGEKDLLVQTVCGLGVCAIALKRKVWVRGEKDGVWVETFLVAISYFAIIGVILRNTGISIAVFTGVEKVSNAFAKIEIQKLTKDFTIGTIGADITT